MRRLSITADSLEVISAFKSEANAAQRSRFDQVIDSLEDGSWCGRWWPCAEHPTDPDFCELHPGSELLILFNQIYDEVLDSWLANIIRIDTDESYDERACGL